MGKGRFSALDVLCLVPALQSLSGARLSNIYDLSTRLFSFKLTKNDNKVHLLVESGIRMHTTQYIRHQSDTPGNFCVKLRKHLRTKLLTNVKQLGRDRVVVLTFGMGEYAYHVIVELYAAGNVILTDADYRILSLLRNYELEEDNRKVAVGEIYLGMKEEGKIESKNVWRDAWKEKLKEEKCTIAGLVSILTVNPMLMEHVAKERGVKLQMKTELASIWNGSGDFGMVDTIWEILEETEILTNQLASEPSKGYLIIKEINPKDAKEESTLKSQAEDTKAITYSEFTPMLLHMHDELKFVEFASFNEALDEYYTKLEASTETSKMSAQEAAALFKVERIRSDHQSKVADLQLVSETALQKAFVLQYHADFVDDILTALRAVLATGMDWHDLSVMIREQKKLQNPIAIAIHSLRFEHNKVLVSLPNVLPEETVFEEDELEYQMEEEIKREADADKQELLEDYNIREEQAKKKIEKRKKQKQGRKGIDDPNASKPSIAKKLRPKQLVIELDLDLSSYSNAEVYFSARKKSQEKENKTLAATEKALKKAEKTMKREVASIEQQSRIKAMRKVFWFEKFHWFITSENYLVIAGRDAQQNEALVKKYLKKNDVYIHAEVHGASSVVIKNPQNAAVPPLSLSQAALMAVARSSAWENKVLAASYWVHANQVSKSAPTGEYLPTGSFMIRGKRNPIPSAPMVMGMALLFHLDESSFAAHLNERRPRMESEAMENEEESGDETESISTPISILEALPNADVDEENFGIDVTSKIALVAQQSMVSVPLDSVAAIAAVPNLDWNPDAVIEEEKRHRVPGKKRISVAERRRLKKGILEPELVTERSSTISEEIPEHAIPAKKFQLKKIKEKYKDQDEEEREIRAQLLGRKANQTNLKDFDSASIVSKAVGGQGCDFKAAKKQDEIITLQSPFALDPKDNLKTCFICHTLGHVSSNCPKKPQVCALV